MQAPARSSLPALDPVSAQHSLATRQHLQQAIRAAGGWLPFAQWMAQALYAPSLGYYAAGNQKLADSPAAPTGALPAGDFVTAPQLSPLFAQTLARQAAQILQHSASHTILEFGAGTGALAEGLLRALDSDGLEVQYQIMEVSAELRARQQARLAPYGQRVRWLNALPDAFSGCVLANEVLDAMPVSLFCWSAASQVQERGVALDEQAGFIGKTGLLRPP